MLQKPSNVLLLSMTFLSVNLRKSLPKLVFPQISCPGVQGEALLQCWAATEHRAELLSQPGQDGAEHSREQMWQNILQLVTTLPVVCVERFFLL